MILNHTIAKPVEQVYPYLSDMEKFVQVHPVVYKVEKIGETEYQFCEKIKIIFIPFDFKYKVNLKSILHNKDVEMHSNVKKGVHLELKFSFLSRNNSTHVEEIILIKSNFFVRLVFQSVIKRVHKKMFKNISEIVWEQQAL